MSSPDPKEGEEPKKEEEEVVEGAEEKLNDSVEKDFRDD
jgi:hypothetical protein